jgi:hypothetical protein
MVLLVDLIRRLLADPARRLELGQFGRKFAIDHFGLAAMAERLAIVYDDSLSRYGALPWVRDLRCEVPQLVRSVRRLMPTFPRSS